MGEFSVAPDRFWREFKTELAGGLSDEQRSEIDRVLGMPPPATISKELGDLRLSFKWFFVRLAWGPEKRNPERLKKEQEMYPLMSRRNAPMLLTLFAGYTIFWYMAAALATLLAVLYLI
ncbi:MAG: hypothetical protein APF80_05845 [Alphaproteobacteria bacterium BRH_c36]|nr:MAG: hypothetical protein APF80_05845 [Alphaproteobacteria bacterium BRH_c36]